MKFLPAFLVVILVSFVPVSSSLAQKDIFGDFNCDGLINEVDKLAHARILAAGQFDPDADFNLDGVVNPSDFLILENLCQFALGDGNGDGAVDSLDNLGFRIAFNGSYNRQYDFDGDGIVGNSDVQLFLDALLGVANSGIIGDLNGDCLINDADKAILSRLIQAGLFDPLADLNQDGVVDLLDVGPAQQLCAFSLGDGNADGIVNSFDIGGLFAAMSNYDRQYDFDGDGDVDNTDTQVFIKILLG